MTVSSLSPLYRRFGTLDFTPEENDCSAMLQCLRFRTHCTLSTVLSLSLSLSHMRERNFHYAQQEEKWALTLHAVLK